MKNINKPSEHSALQHTTPQRANKEADHPLFVAEIGQKHFMRRQEQQLPSIQLLLFPIRRIQDGNQCCIRDHYGTSPNPSIIYYAGPEL